MPPPREPPPSIFQKAITGGSEYDDQIAGLMDRRLPVSEIYERLVVDRRTVDALWEELESRSLAAALRERFAGIVRVRR